MSTITIEIAVPVWRAGGVRDAISPSLFRSAELTVAEHWSVRRPLAWRFTLTGPAFQVHKVAGDVQGLGMVRYEPRQLVAATVLVALAMLAGPAFAEGNHNGGPGTVAGNRVGNQCCRRNDDGTINRQDAIAYWRNLFESNNPPTQPNAFERFIDRYIDGPIRDFFRPGTPPTPPCRGCDGLRGSVQGNAGSFTVGPGGTLGHV
jgi:hypothetical protein